MTKRREKKEFHPAARKKVNVKPSERGLGPDGGGWNIHQAAAWSGIGAGSLREMAKRAIETRDPRLFPCFLIGSRRILIPRQGFMEWFNKQAGATAA
jgi:hypothetical protein